MSGFSEGSGNRPQLPPLKEGDLFFGLVAAVEAHFTQHSTTPEHTFWQNDAERNRRIVTIIPELRQTIEEHFSENNCKLLYCDLDTVTNPRELSDMVESSDNSSGSIILAVAAKVGELEAYNMQDDPESLWSGSFQSADVSSALFEEKPDYEDNPPSLWRLNPKSKVVELIITFSTQHPPNIVVDRSW